MPGLCPSTAYFTQVTTRGDIKCAALVNVPLLSSAPAGWDVFLVDTPGYGEHHQEIAAAAEAILKESSAFVYVMDYNVIGGEADANYLRQLYEHDKGNTFVPMLIPLPTPTLTCSRFKGRSETLTLVGKKRGHTNNR